MKEDLGGLKNVVDVRGNGSSGEEYEGGQGRRNEGRVFWVRSEVVFYAGCSGTWVWGRGSGGRVEEWQE